MIKGIERKVGIKGKVRTEGSDSVSDTAILGSPKPSPWCTSPWHDSIVGLAHVFAITAVLLCLRCFISFSFFFFCLFFALVLSSIHQFSRCSNASVNLTLYLMNHLFILFRMAGIFRVIKKIKIKWYYFYFDFNFSLFLKFKLNSDWNVSVSF